MPKLTDDDQRAIIAQRLSVTATGRDSELRADRETALNHYYGRPYGNEQEGRSQVVTKDLMDTIEWMMPSLLRIFATKDAVQFDPVGPEDEELAKQETAYVSHVMWKKNPGFMLIYNWIKDALMQKVGYVKYWWEDEEKVKFHEYSGLTEEQLVLTYMTLQQQGEVEIVGRGAIDEEKGTYSFKARVKKRYGCAKYEVIPPDEMIVDRNCRGCVKDAKLVGHLRKNITRSDLMQMGFSRKELDNLVSYDWANISESLARDTVGESVGGDEDDNADWATKEFTLLDCYTYLDVDDDGIAELRHYLLSGDAILENDEAAEIQFESWTPIPVPHRHVGLSVDDLMEDLQRINTALNRGMLDNVYFTMNQRIMYDKNTVDVSMLQINRPGGHVAVDGPPGMSAMPVPVSPMAGQLLPVIDYISQTKETRTGVGRMTAGVDADVLARSTKGAYVDAKSASNQRIEAIARIFAETGLASFYNSIHRLLTRHQDWEDHFKLRGEWITVNPAEWQERTNLTVSVGLGNSSQEETRSNLSLMAAAQEKLRSGDPGLVQSKNMYALFRRVQTALGFENDEFATDPKSPEYQQYVQSQQGQKDPFVQGEEIKAGANMAGKQLDAQVKREQMAQDSDLKITEMELDAGVDLAKAGIGAEVAAQRNAATAARGNGAAAPRQSGAAGSVSGA